MILKIAIITLILSIIHQGIVLGLRPTFPNYDFSSPSTEEPIFPDNFKFGVSTAAYQIEADVPPSNWMLWEQQVDKNGKQRAPTNQLKCDGFNRFLQDAELAKSMGCKIYRFSFSWSRLNPAPGEFRSDILMTYREWCVKLREMGMEPLVTIWHFEHPAWLEKSGSINSTEFVKAFEEYCKFVVNGIYDVCDLYHTTNEPIGFVSASLFAGIHPPGKGTFTDIINGMANLMECHAIGYRIIHEKNPKAKVSFAKNLTPMVPVHKWSLIETLGAWIMNYYNSVAFDVFKTGKIRFLWMTREVPGIINSLDFISLNHYYVIFFSIDPRDWAVFEGDTTYLMSYGQRFIETSDFHWGMFSNSLAESVKWTNRLFNPNKLPILISEHGCADATDIKRRWFLRDSLKYLSEIPKEEVNLMGYVHWTLFDNYEWAAGTDMKFGLFETNFTTLERTPRESAKIYQRIISAQKKHHK